jgi:hypothetical protein
MRRKLGFSVVKGIKTVAIHLEEKGEEAILSDPRVDDATRDISTSDVVEAARLAGLKRAACDPVKLSLLIDASACLLAYYLAPKCPHDLFRIG